MVSRCRQNIDCNYVYSLLYCIDTNCLTYLDNGKWGGIMREYKQGYRPRHDGGDPFLHTSNAKCSELVGKKLNFNGAINPNAQGTWGSSIFGFWHDFENYELRNIYAVYSYGQHFPMYVYDKSIGKWFGNYDKYSRSTSKHQAQARPNGVEIEWTNTINLKNIIHSGGLAKSVINRATH